MERLSFLILTLLFSIGSISAQLIIPEELEGRVPFEDETQKVGEFVDERKWEYIGDYWQEYFLDNKYISGVDSVFKKFNIVFVVLFARSYEFGITLYFAFLMWLFTFLWIPKFWGVFINNNLKYLTGPLSVIALAHLQIFNNISEAMFKAMFYRTGALWSFIIFVFLMVALIIYLYIGNRIVRLIESARKEKKKQELKHKVDVLEEFGETMRKMGK